MTNEEEVTFTIMEVRKTKDKQQDEKIQKVDRYLIQPNN